MKTKEYLSKIPALIEGVQQRSPDEKQVTVVVSKYQRGRSDADYLLCFSGNLLGVMVELNLSAGDIKVLLALAGGAAFGNAVDVSNKALSQITKMPVKSVSRCRCHLRDAGVLYRDNIGVERINLAILLRGSIGDLGHGGRFAEAYVESVRAIQDRWTPEGFTLPRRIYGDHEMD